MFYFLVGAMRFDRCFTWDNMADVCVAPRVILEGPEGYMEGYISAYDKMKYYWMLNGRHIVNESETGNTRECSQICYRQSYALCKHIFNYRKY